MTEQTKFCPYCGENILQVAKKCKYCGKWLEEKTTTNPTFVQNPKTLLRQALDDKYEIQIVILGWILSLISSPFYLLFKSFHLYKNFRRKINIQFPIYGSSILLKKNEVSIPGRLVIVAGPQKGKSIKLKGTLEKRGTVLTIGKKEITKNKAENSELTRIFKRGRNLQLQIKNPTISKFQAKILYMNSVLYIKSFAI